MFISILTYLFRKYYAGDDKYFVFKFCDLPRFSYSDINNINLYIHIPFCKHNCPYCPYNKIEWDDNKASLYYPSLIKEFNFYYNENKKVNIPSIYFGGGSPTISITYFQKIIDFLYSKFNNIGEICIEMNPNECDNNRLKVLKDNSISFISIGIQSFQDKNLQIIGRNYNSITSLKAIENSIKYFDNINIDLMFALDNQNLNDIENDLKIAISNKIKQITIYPLFTFPYSTIGKYKKLKNIKMPNLFKRREQYYFIYDYLISNGYERISVWSFTKDSNKKYSSVTRDGYLGFGAGAGTHFPYAFYLNTFSIDEYINRINNNKFPTALEFKMSEYLNNLFWLYWRFYDTRIPIIEFNKRFDGINKIQNLIKLFIKLGLIIQNNQEFVLTKKGAFWLHLAQNFFSLNYINKIWSVAMNTPFPEEIYF